MQVSPDSSAPSLVTPPISPLSGCRPITSFPLPNEETTRMSSMRLLRFPGRTAFWDSGEELPPPSSEQSFSIWQCFHPTMRSRKDCWRLCRPNKIFRSESCNWQSMQGKFSFRIPVVLLQSALRQRQDEASEDEEGSRRHLPLQEHLRRHVQDHLQRRFLPLVGRLPHLLPAYRSPRLHYPHFAGFHHRARQGIQVKKLIVCK